MPPAATLAAAFAPISADFQLNVWNVIVLLTALTALLAALRRKPPLDSQLVQLGSSISSLQASVEALTTEQKRQAAHEAKIEALQEKVRLLEAQRETDAAAQRRHLAHVQHEIFQKFDQLDAKFGARLETLDTKVSANLQSIERGLGRFESAVDFIRDSLNARTP